MFNFFKWNHTFVTEKDIGDGFNPRVTQVLM